MTLRDRTIGRRGVCLWQECRMNFRQLLVWGLCVGGICLGALSLYESLGESMGEMSEMFSDLGAFSEALGMDRVGIGTLEGYYAVEISILFSLGGAMFAAMLGASLMAKEEEGHTCEFLNVLPLGRGRILGEKYGAMVVLLAAFHLIGIGMVLPGFAWVGTLPDMGRFALYHGGAFLMNLEIGTICFLLSVLWRKKPIGVSIGFAVLLYMMDLLCRAVPALEKVKYITPFYYSNAADIFAEGEICIIPCGIGIAVTMLALCLAYFIYKGKDLG